MKRLHLWITLVAAVPLLTGCNETESLETEHVPLSFSTAVDAQTRVTDLTTDNLTSMGVFASFSQGDFNASTATPDFMYNQIVERTDAATPWTYSPVKYWPNNVKDKISFFAYAPHNSKITTDALAMSGITDKGYPSLTFTNQTAQTDFLLAEPLMNKDNTQNSIKFNFKHALAKVSFYVKNGDATSGKKVHSFAVHSRQSGKYTFNETGFVYTSANTTMREDAITTTPVDIPQNTTDKVLLETLFIHPDTETNISLTYSINGNDANKVEITNQKVPATPALVSGANINYIITVNKDNYTITASNEKEWAQGSENKITYYEAKDLKIGDYYYSDGSTSDGGLRMIDHGKGLIVWEDPLPSRSLTNPQTNSARECIGVVFSTRMSDKDKERGWTHGYVLGLSRFNGIWSPSGSVYDTSLPNIGNLKGMYNDLNGYDNTYTIKNSLSEEDYKTKHPLFYTVTSFAQPRPAGTSEWFLPSIGQMWDLCEILGDQMPKLMGYRTSSGANLGGIPSSVFSKINQHLTNAGGTAYLEGSAYWFSSTENSNAFAVLINSFAPNPIAFVSLYKWAPDIHGPGRGLPVFAF